MRQDAEEHRGRQVAAGAVILAVILTCVGSLVLGWRYVPGVLGEWLGIIAGLVSSPITLEISFATLGFVIVILLNHWREKKDGDEFVYLDQVEGEIPRDLPETARLAVYTKPPLAGVEPSLLEKAEGALAIGDFTIAADCVAEMSAEELERIDTLRLQRDLALACGKTGLAERLGGELAAREAGK